MKAQLNPVQRRICRKPRWRAQFESRPKAPQRGRHEQNVQLIYAHLPPAVVLAVDQHLRAQTNIEQRFHQLWFARGCRPGGTLNDWIRAETEVVQNLCQALLDRNPREPQPDPISQ